LPDVLQSVPGINVVQANGPGGLTAVYTRGTNPNHTKVLLDGVDVSDPSSVDRSFDFSQLLALNLQRVEVLRGPQSGLYGADALGGAIVIYTKEGQKGPPVVQGLVEAGSFGTLNEAVGAGGSVDNVTYSVNGAHMYVGHTPVTPIEILEPGVPRNDNTYEASTTSAKFGIDLSRDVTVNLAGTYLNADLAYTGDHYDANFNARPDAVRSTQHTEMLAGRAEVVVRSFDGRVFTYFGANGLDNSRDYTSPTTGPASYYGNREKYDWRTVVGVAPGTLVTVGADWQKEYYSTAGFAASEEDAGGYFQLQTEPIHNLFLTGNVRGDSDQTFGEAITWRFSSAYVFDQTGTKLKANIGTAFKAPSLDDRFHNYPDFFFFANPNLRPEESLGWDAGFEQPLFNGKAQFGAVYFSNDITNLIQSGPIPGQFAYTLFNIGQAKTQGVEAFVSADLTDRLRVRLDYTFTDAIDEITGLELLHRPRNKFTAIAGWRPINPLLLTGSVLYVGETADNDRVTFNRITLPGYTVLRVAAEYELNSNMTLFGRIDNLTDTHYQNPAGFDATGIGVFGGVKLRN
jgi:vitamin B12 transporter